MSTTIDGTRMRLASMLGTMVMVHLLAGCTTMKLPSLGECRPCFEPNPSASAGPSQSLVCRHCFEIRTRNPHDRSGSQLMAGYGEEFRYVENRRQRVSPSPVVPSGPPPNLIGVALSGGGIRSASFSLGALQALERSGVWDQIDYMSGASGGGYLAGWVQAHLGQGKTFKRDEYHYQVRAETERDLLANHGDSVEHLRTHTGFLNEGGWFEGGRIFGDWLWRWPFHLVLDDVVHLRGLFNFQHVLNVYRHRIERTYLRGSPPAGVAEEPIAALPLEDVNAPEQAATTPYFVLNANLTNRGRSQIGVPCENCPQPGERSCKQWNFEFTRDFVGSDGTGYVNTRAYGLRPADVRRDENGIPGAVVIRDHPDDNSVTKSTLDSVGFSGTHRFGLSEAMAASGAAFDSAALAYQLDLPVVDEIGQFIVGGIFNLYLGAESPNFARDDRYGGFLDYLYMMTLQRLPRLVTTGARWLYVTDGGHYDNLAVLALLRRGVKCVIAFDATADPHRNYSDLDTLRKRVREDLGLQMVDPPGGFPADGNDPEGRYRFRVVGDDGNTEAVVLYVKSSADETLPHMRPLDSRARAVAHIRRAREREKALANGKDAMAIDSFYRELEVGDDRVAKENAERRATMMALRSCRDEPNPIPSKECDEIRAQCRQDSPSEPTSSAAAILSECVAKALNAKIDGLELANRHAWVDEDHAIGELQNVLEKDFPNPNRDQEVARIRQELRHAARDDQDRADRIEKILSYARTSGSKGTFPHNSTLVEWYDWERFDAYRMLGFQEATTYIDRFDPHDQGDRHNDVPWCNFGSFPQSRVDDVADQGGTSRLSTPTKAPPHAARRRSRP